MDTFYPSSYSSQYYLSAVKYYKEHHFASAYSQIKQVLKIDPDYKDAYILLGDIYRESGLYPEAVKKYQRALEIDPMDRNTNYKLALTYWNIGNYYQAARQFNVMLKKFNIDDIELINNLASCYTNIELYIPALEKYKEILKIDPAYATAYYNIGIIYFSYYRDYKKAIKEWIRALEIDPSMEDARVYVSNAKIMLKEKRNEQKRRK